METTPSMKISNHLRGEKTRHESGEKDGTERWVRREEGEG